MEILNSKLFNEMGLTNKSDKEIFDININNSECRATSNLSVAYKDMTAYNKRAADALNANGITDDIIREMRLSSLPIIEKICPILPEEQPEMTLKYSIIYKNCPVPESTGKGIIEYSSEINKNYKINNTIPQISFKKGEK